MLSLDASFTVEMHQNTFFGRTPARGAYSAPKLDFEGWAERKRKKREGEGKKKGEGADFGSSSENFCVRPCSILRKDRLWFRLFADL